jgi:serine/threonine protein kinase
MGISVSTPLHESPLSPFGDDDEDSEVVHSISASNGGWISPLCNTLGCLQCFSPPNTAKEEGQQKARRRSMMADKFQGGPVLANNRFTLGRKLSSGGSGAVYVAWDSLKEKQVAIKLLNADSHMELYRERILAVEPRYQELRNHPLLICSQEYIVLLPGEIAQRLNSVHGKANCIFVMELLGKDFRHTINRNDAPHNGVSIQCFTKALYDLLEAIEFLHGMGLVHRDIKPGIYRGIN